MIDKDFFNVTYHSGLSTHTKYHYEGMGLHDFFHLPGILLCTAIPNRELQVFYMEICIQGNSNYMLWQCTGFEGSNFNEIQGNICILYIN